MSEVARAAIGIVTVVCCVAIVIDMTLIEIRDELRKLNIAAIIAAKEKTQ